jgi:hypothetical protein
MGASIFKTSKQSVVYAAPLPQPLKCFESAGKVKMPQKNGKIRKFSHPFVKKRAFPTGLLSENQ